MVGIKAFLRVHYLAIIFAVLVGLIYITPHLFFMVSLGNSYRGIPNFQTPNEISYLARIREVLDGHPMLGSPFHYEYKDQWPLTPPTGELFYAVPAYLFGVSAENILMASKFILPFILFLMLYFLIRALILEPDYFYGKVSAIAGAFLITLGYDLVDFRTTLNFISGESSPGSFLIWARPINPILGAIFLSAFLLLVLAIIRGTKKGPIFLSGLFLALMIGSYFFSWGMAASVLFVLVLIYFFKKRYAVVRRLSAVFLVGFLFSAPYWYVVWQASQSEWYTSSVLRSGLFLTHFPLLNKFVLAGLIFYVLVVFLLSRDKLSSFKDWHWMLLAFFLGSLLAYNQQIITGRTIWPYHFVQYSIPLVMIAVIVLWHNVFKKISFHLWASGIFIIIAVSLIYGVYVQASAYRLLYEYHVERQPLRSIFDWLNSKEKDCVVLLSKDTPETNDLNIMIPAFTHCNRYASSETPSLMPYERISHNYLTHVFIRGVGPGDIEGYLAENAREARTYLFSNWKGVYGSPDFPDFSDPLLEQRLKEFPKAYRQFMMQDFKAELNKYRLDYILSVDPLPKSIAGQLEGIELIFNSNNVFLYEFTSE